MCEAPAIPLARAWYAEFTATCGGTNETVEKLFAAKMDRETGLAPEVAAVLQRKRI